MPKEILVVFLSGSNYNKPAKDFEGNFKLR